MYVLQVMAPVALIVVLGGWLRARGRYDAVFFREINRLVYWIGLPALLFVKTAHAELAESWSGRLVWTILLGGVVSLLAGAAALWWRPLPERSRGAFLQACLRGNLAYLGLPLALYALDGAARSAGAEARAALTIAPLVVFYNLVSVPLLLWRTDRKDAGRRAALAQAGRALATNPLILSCGGGLIFSLLGGRLPPALTRTGETLGQMALPLALLSLGATLRLDRLRQARGPALRAAAIKCFVTPLAGAALAWMFGLSAADRLIALLYLATPTAVASYVMADQLGADAELAGAAVVAGTLLSTASFAAVLAWGS